MPELVERVHQVYEELGRKDVQAVEDMEKANRGTQTDEANADAQSEDNAKPEEGAQS